jgi:hypothetical protein
MTDWSGRAGIVTLMLEQLQRPSVILSFGWRFCWGYRACICDGNVTTAFIAGLDVGLLITGYLVSLLDVVIGQYSRTEGV